MIYGWSMMGGYGFGHWIFFAVMVVLLIYPVGRILGRMGLSPLWAIVAFIPLVNVIGLWVLAFADWPARRGWSSGM